MKNRLLVWLLLLPLCSSHAQTNAPLISAVAVLTIHVSDTNTHAAVFHLLADVLQLPVEYYPRSLGQRRYGAVYAGNMFIEPCGPYSDMSYPVKDFKALFFGLNCVSANSPEFVAAGLRKSAIQYEPDGPKLFRILDHSVAEGIYLALDCQPATSSAVAQEAQWRATLIANTNKAVGFEYVSEIWLGSVDPNNRERWDQLLGKGSARPERVWQLNKQQRIRFVKSDIAGVRGIVCKVNSLERAETYLTQTALVGRRVNGRIELDPATTFGLRIYFAQ